MVKLNQKEIDFITGSVELYFESICPQLNALSFIQFIGKWEKEKQELVYNVLRCFNNETFAFYCECMTLISSPHKENDISFKID